MRKLIMVTSLLLAVLMIFTACSPASQDKPNGTTAVDKPSATGETAGNEKIRVAFIPQLTGIPYFTAMERGGKEAAEKFDVEFIYNGSTEVSAAEQVQIMDSLIRQKVEAICVSVLDSSSIDPIIKKAKAERHASFHIR